MKFLLEHDIPRRLRYARVYLEAGTASLFLSVDGASAHMYGSIGARRTGKAVSDKEYARLRALVPAVETVDDGRFLIVRDAKGYEERWIRPRWVLAGLRRRQRRPGGEGS
jgi:hypothetical protein